MNGGRLRWSLVVSALGASVACASTGSDDVVDHPEIRELERRALGVAQPYPAATLSAADDARYARSKQARRELGWSVLAKALAPVTIAAKLPAAANKTGKFEKTIPLFRTWFGGDEFDRMFAKMYGDLGKERRKAKSTPTLQESEVLFGWNASALGPNSEEEYFARLALITDKPGVDGLGGNARVAYSPGYVKHLLTEYPAIQGCEGKLETFSADTPPISEETNFTNCFSSEFPADAVAVKMSWRRNDALVTAGLPVVDTTAASLAKRLKGELDGGGWSLKGLPMKAAGPDEAYTVKLSDAAGYSLVGLHLMTKELRHWVWVTMWWSDTPNDDFGQDRPQAIAKLGPPWNHYKMNVITDFEEKDPDPRGGFKGTLGDALAAVHAKATWASNGFIEKGPHNAQTNCIGCHQHAGDVRALDRVLTEFPSQGREKIRRGFPSDYTWAFATPASPDQKDRLLDVIVSRIKTYDSDDEAPSH